ncbi:MAG: glycerol-3-phosphate 1-O-acyltransferase PlsY [Acutalibacteraceae bacterium]|nr:glycerol-3-phosphate 1-O-acyltransferase PlsY [Acutalibacteraceae bacterium]
MRNLIYFISTGWLQILITAFIGYLLGSINFAIIITKIVDKKNDIREMGSGNAGFTNVLRSVGRGPAVFTIAFDFIKALLAVAIGGIVCSTIVTGNSILSGEFIVYGKYLAGLFCIAGHMFPVYFGFRGGKGVVTTAGLMVVADWRTFLVAITIFAIIFLATKIISLSSLICAATYPVSTFLFTYLIDYRGAAGTEFAHSRSYVIISTLFTMLIGLCVIIKHSGNIKRLLNGTEKKITAKK